MSKLVERGREYSDMYDHTEITSELCDEITRLTAENERLQKIEVEYIKLLSNPQELRKFIEQQLKIEAVGESK